MESGAETTQECLLQTMNKTSLESGAESGGDIIAGKEVTRVLVLILQL